MLSLRGSQPLELLLAARQPLLGVEILLSPTGKEDDFHSVGTLKMEPIGRDQALELKPPRKARFVKFRFLKNGGGSWIQAHEVKVFAEPEATDLDARCAALFDANSQVRRKAAESLKKSGDPRPVPFLVQRVADDRADHIASGDKGAALDALRALGPNRVGGALVEACRCKTSAMVRAWAARQFVRCKDQLDTEHHLQAAQALAERVADDRVDIVSAGDKTAALKALRVLDPDRAKQALERAKGSTSPGVAKWVSRQ